MPPDGVVQRQPVERAGVLGGEILRLRVTKPPANRSFWTRQARDDPGVCGIAYRFKETQVVRLVDLRRRTLVYLAYSTRVVEGSPFNSLSIVPVMRWEQ